MKRIALCLVLTLANPALAQQSPGDIAREASDYLAQAALALSEADSARNRIAALTTTVRAYERGLEAMREGLRRAALEERVLRERLGGRDAELMSLLATLQSIERSGGAVQTLHPDGPLPAIRTGMLASAFVPALNERAQSLASELQDVSAIVAVQQAGAKQLEQGLDGIREARLALAEAIAKRTDLPDRVSTDDAAMQAIINSSETLGAFADTFARDDPLSSPTDKVWDLPVIGTRVRDFDEADAAGIRRPGWIVATETNAIVTTPTEATVRFAGELPEQGHVVILEPRLGELLILAGIGETFVRRNQILSAGDPIGLMSGKTDAEQQNLIETEVSGGQRRPETLYIELRQGREAVDPAARFSEKTE